MKTLIWAAFAGSLLASSVSFAGAPITFDGPMAKKHAGKFIFSTKPIALDAKTEDGFTTSFTLKDKIFIRFWGSDTPENLNTKCRRERRVSYKVTVNGGKTGYMGVVRVGKTVSALSPTGDPKRPLTTKTVFGDKVTKKTHSFIREWNGYVIPRLKEGANKVRMWATIDCGYGQKTDPTIAETEVTITVGKGDQAAYTKKFGPLLPKHQVKGGKKLMRKVVTLMTNKWGNEDVVGGRFAGDWYTKFRKYTRIATHRSAHVMLVTRLKKETHPKACRVFNIWVKQPSKDGRKRFMTKDVLWDGVSGNDPISCDAVKRVKAG